MTLSGADAWLARWVVSDGPSPEQVHAAEGWLSRLEEDPTQSPSRTASPDHAHPGDEELRLAYLIDADAFVIYGVDSASRSRIVFIGRHPPAGLDAP